MLAGYSWLVWIIIGGLAGGIAKLLMPGRDPGGCIVTVLLGIAGALLAGWLGHAIGWYKTGEGAGFIAAVRRRVPAPVDLSPDRQPAHLAARSFSKQPWGVGEHRFADFWGQEQ